MSDQIQEVEIDIQEAKRTISKMNALNKLILSDDFKNVILEGYFETEASNLVLSRANPNLQSEEMQASNTKSIDAIGSLRQYFISINHFGRMATKALEDDELTREELLAEDM